MLVGVEGLLLIVAGLCLIFAPALIGMYCYGR